MRMGFDDCWLKARLAPKISTAKVPKRTVREALLRSLIADLPFIQLQRLVDRASGLTTSAARPPRARRERPSRRATKQRDEVAPPHGLPLRPRIPLLHGRIGRRPDAASTPVQPRGRDPRCARFRPGRAAPCARALSRRSKAFGETALRQGPAPARRWRWSARVARRRSGGLRG